MSSIFSSIIGLLILVEEKKAIPKRASTAKLISREIVKIMAEDNLAEIILLGDFNENPMKKILNN